MNWLAFALLSALFASLTAVFAKIGVKNIDANLATAIRTVIIVFFSWGLVFCQGTIKQVGNISKFSLLFLIISGITTALSWLFYFRALQTGDASRVTSIDKLSILLTIFFAVIFLREKITPNVLLGALLMSLGAILISFQK
jgi:transporter family protein